MPLLELDQDVVKRRLAEKAAAVILHKDINFNFYDGFQAVLPSIPKSKLLEKFCRRNQSLFHDSKVQFLFYFFDLILDYHVRWEFTVCLDLGFERDNDWTLNEIMRLTLLKTIFYYQMMLDLKYLQSFIFATHFVFYLGFSMEFGR